MIADWFVMVDSRVVGPYTGDALLAAMHRGSIPPTTKVRHLNGPWISASQAFSILTAAANAAMPLTAVPYSAPPGGMPQAQPAVVRPPLPSLSEQAHVSSAPRSRLRSVARPVNAAMMMVAILLGGAAAVFVYSKIGYLFRPQPQPEPEIIVIRERDTSSPQLAARATSTSPAATSTATATVVVGRPAAPAFGAAVIASAPTTIASTQPQPAVSPGSAAMPATESPIPSPTAGRRNSSNIYIPPRTARIEQTGGVAAAGGGGLFPVAAVASSRPSAQPQARPQPVAQPANMPTTWVSTAQAILGKRDVLMQEYEAVQADLRPLLQEGLGVDSRLKQIDQMIRVANKNYAALDAQIAELRAVERLTKQSQAAQISILQNQMYQLEQGVSNLRSEAGPLISKRTALMNKVTPLRATDEKLSAQASDLREELLWHLNPFEPIEEQLAAEALIVFDELASRSKTSDMAWGNFCRACIHQRQNRLDLADEQFTAALDLQPNDATFLAVRGACRARRDATKGLDDMIAAGKAEAKNATVRYLYALVQLRRDSLTGAEAQLRLCLEADADHAKGQVLLALLKATAPDDKFRRGAYARTVAEKALSTDTAAAKFALGVAAAEVGEFTTAVRHVKSALQDSRLSAKQAEWYRATLQSFEASKPLRIDWKAFDFWTLV